MRLLRDAVGGLGRPRVAALLMFLTSLPVYLPFAGAVPLAPVVDGDAMGFVPQFLTTSALCALFVALAMLFVCLLKTAYARVSYRLVIAGAALYLVGQAALVVGMTVPGAPLGLLAMGGVPLGAGGAILCFFWALHLRWADVRTSLAGVLGAFFAMSVVHLALHAIAVEQLTFGVLAVLAVAGAAGTCRAARGFDRDARAGGAGVGSSATDEGANWWDIFGRFDVSVVPAAGEYATPLSRVLFFVVVPLAVLMLMAVNHTFPAGEQAAGPATLAGTCLAAFCALPLLFAKTDRNLIALAFRTCVPALAFAAVALAAFLDSPLDAWILYVGVGAYCTLYSILFAALLLSTPGRMRSLALPCAGFLIIAVNIAVLLVISPWDEGQVLSLRPVLAFACLAASVLLLMAMPGACMWSVMMDLIPFEGAGDAAAQIPSFAETSLELAHASSLTDRETEVFVFLTRGHGSAYIARNLGVSESTIRSHRTNIYRKLGVSSREELLALIDEHCQTAEPAADVR